jgi:hypothetical protein
MHLRHESMGPFNFSPFRDSPGCVSYRTMGTIRLIAIYESANFEMNFHPRGVE